MTDNNPRAERDPPPPPPPRQTRPSGRDDVPLIVLVVSLVSIVALGAGATLVVSRPAPSPVVPDAKYRATCPPPEALVIEGIQAFSDGGMLRVQDLSGRWWTLPPTCTAAPIVGPDR